MRLSLRQARKGLGRTSPNPAVGAVIVREDKVIASGYHKRAGANHAEVEALNKIGKKGMKGDVLYVTLEPCPMCAGALVHARVKRLVYGAGDYKTGAAGSVFNLLRSEKLNHQVEVTAGVLAEQCATKISDFFKRRRKEKKALKKQKCVISLSAEETL